MEMGIDGAENGQTGNKMGRTSRKRERAGNRNKTGLNTENAHIIGQRTSTKQAENLQSFGVYQVHNGQRVKRKQIENGQTTG